MGGVGVLTPSNALMAALAAGMVVMVVHVQVRRAARQAGPDGRSQHSPAYGWIFVFTFAAVLALLHMAGARGGVGKAQGGGGPAPAAAGADVPAPLTSLEDVMRYIDRADPAF